MPCVCVVVILRSCRIVIDMRPARSSSCCIPNKICHTEQASASNPWLMSWMHARTLSRARFPEQAATSQCKMHGERRGCTHVLEAGKGADADLPAALPPRDAPVARLAARERIAAPAHEGDHLLLQTAQATVILMCYQRPRLLACETGSSYSATYAVCMEDPDSA